MLRFDIKNTAVFTTDRSLGPVAIEVRRIEDGDDAVPGKGIWKIEGGDRLTICVTDGERARSTDFTAAGGYIIMVMQRATPSCELR